MPLKLNVGFSKKLGQPDFGSLGAMCNVEVELESSLIQSDLEGFHRHVRNAFTACRQAVDDELSRHQPGNGQPASHAEHPAGSTNGSSNGNRNGTGNGNGTSAPAHSTARRATASQVRALHAITKRQQVDLTRLVQERFHVDRPDDLSITDASQLIDELKGTTADSGGRR